MAATRWGAPARTQAATHQEEVPDGGNEAADGRRSAGSHQGRARHRDARPARRWRPPGRRAERRGGRRSRRCPQGRRRLSPMATVSRTTPTLPPQVSPPQFALSGALPHALNGVDVVALPVLPAVGPDDGGDGGEGAVLLGPGADQVGDLTGADLL